jgi:hypothetical protein
MMQKSSEVLREGSNPKRGVNLKNKVQEIGVELNDSLTEIRNCLPSEYHAEFIRYISNENEDLQVYINSLISGEAINEANSLDISEYNRYYRLICNLQVYLKGKFSEIEEKLK